MNDKQSLREDLALVADLVVAQAKNAGCPEILKKPDFWILGYSGGFCRFVLNRWGLETDMSESYCHMLSTFCRIYGKKRGPRMAAYFFTFHHYLDLLKEVSNFKSIAEPTNAAPKSYTDKENSIDFLQQVRSIYRAEVFDKFTSLSHSIRDVIVDGENQSEKDFEDFFVGPSSVHPRRLTDYLIENIKTQM